MSKIWITKRSWTITHKNWKNRGSTRSRVRLTLKMAERSQKSGSPKDLWTIAHENRQNVGFNLSGDYLTMKMSQFTRPIESIPKVLTDVQEILLAKITSKIRITKRSMDYSKMGVPTVSIVRVLTDVHKFFWKNDIENPDHQKIHGL
ncbi:hypothetical protein H5410_056493 [Solanum commersonii]|uniref:Uncharacterized protein n=1 Tax=Solanum commersonii TaxID=4109 RepID=A0A9J5WMC2_SOLCO|nr:hypothetical protein H5410_056493 [Solanum commersonii]